MTSSGSDVFNPTMVEIFTEAARKINAIGRTQSLTGALLASFRFEANSMVKRWQAMPGSHCWTTVEGTLFPQVGQFQYRAGPSATDHITQVYSETGITTDETLGQTLLSVDDTTDMTIGDFLGVVLDDGSLFWSTVANKTSSTVTSTNPLPDSAAAGNAVFTYTTKITRPLNVLAARRYDIQSGSETPILMEARLDFRALPSKRDAGTLVTMFYDKQLPQGVFNLWRVPNATTELVNFTFNRPLESYLINTDTSDFPQEWVQPLVWNLAAAKIPEFPVAEGDAQRIERNAAQFLADVLGSDRDNESIFVGPDLC